MRNHLYCTLTFCLNTYFLAPPSDFQICFQRSLSRLQTHPGAYHHPSAVILTVTHNAPNLKAPAISSTRVPSTLHIINLRILFTGQGSWRSVKWSMFDEQTASFPMLQEVRLVFQDVDDMKSFESAGITSRELSTLRRKLTEGHLSCRKATEEEIRHWSKWYY